MSDVNMISTAIAVPNAARSCLREALWLPLQGNRRSWI